jgi:hypothetical protein
VDDRRRHRPTDFNVEPLVRLVAREKGPHFRVRAERLPQEKLDHVHIPIRHQGTCTALETDSQLVC